MAATVENLKIVWMCAGRKIDNDYVIRLNGRRTPPKYGPVY
jgi:hypothetical protein